MQDENVFRFILIFVLAVVVPVARYHRMKSWASRERLDRRVEGLFMLLTLRPMVFVVILALTAYMINPAWMAWSAIALPAWLRWVGVAIGVMTGALFILVYRSLGTNLTDTVVTRARHTLVTSGPYRWVRHPFYVAITLAAIANSLVAANWFLGLTGLAVAALLVIRSRVEEEKLLERFGDEYRNYMNRTGKFFPRWNGNRD